MSSLVIWRSPDKRVTAEWNKQGPFTVTVQQTEYHAVRTKHVSEKAAIAAAKRKARQFRKQEAAIMPSDNCEDQTMSEYTATEVFDYLGITEEVATAEVCEAWETLHYALRDAMRNMDIRIVRFMAVQAKNNDLVNEAAQDELEHRAS